MDIKKIPKIYACLVCDYNTIRKQEYNNHILTPRHKINILERVVTQNEMKECDNEKSMKKYTCEPCKYNTVSKKDFEKHELSNKHIKNLTHSTNVSCSLQDNLIQNICKPCIMCSECDKSFANNSGLWKHKKKCAPKQKEESIQKEESTQKEEPKEDIDAPLTNSFMREMFMEMVKSNKELHNIVIEQLAKSQSVTNNNTTTNSNNTNNQFNLHFFLNETCKDALNITEFINSLQVQVQDFVATGQLGFVEGISRIILNGLKSVDVEKRPVHCTDAKRETVYIKDKNLWEKENPDKRKLKWAINRVAQMNFNQLPKWQQEHPEYMNCDNKRNDEFVHLSLTALGGQGKVEEDKFMDKIMRNVMKKVTI